MEQEQQYTLERQVTYWRSQALQLQAERYQLTKKLTETERMLERCERLFGFRTPPIPEQNQEYEPFTN